MNLPNKITLFRIFLIPIFIVLVLAPLNLGTLTVFGSDIDIQLLVAAIVFSVASFTDWLDGYLARKMNIVSNFGKFADPLADKMLVMSALILLVELGLAPSWVVAVIVSRELAVTGLRLILVEQGGTVMAAAWPGKIKTNTQMFAIIFLLINDFPFGGLNVSVGTILLYVCLFFTIYSGVNYFYEARDVFSGTFSK
ncbi:CDP-diacylglycerol--glycerol-3-phosphate 3-phosphatidyltransferase [Alkalibacterium pelagium]|jgi:CDP-diacylglycerol--glycerol-3-phosphate 3-phosphatidyltransferase|uniref:CDP-diacylglycerol--glycerol-3-phosphate 3-phosphatidyltransferase n=1 Tax=Alkalibacterium pelagium TaxID=426702 RepID=A0A1H7NAE8_9LACT|nr:CDP-diacylglycerol--glycerol-3-phosphate 3-phosphatidyltransferase [Alkalibacterium pelagium]GEN51400.1 CDP-diacylglycerol--glycerol-3-phosphate 3-phosphatidyltransferase [Alkalibacterium pelagium]SEL20249.1 CDP-diacylglycerol--glycerol-3-phosphate 3-phosphatidyltransferase [Alkalibacterium pelagium]